MNKLQISIVVSVFLLIATARTTLAQQYPVFTQYYFNELVINPAYAGAHVQLSLTSMYRDQWVNFPGAPRTFSFSGHTSMYKGKIGLGLLVNHDKIGSYSNENVYTYYAYKIRLHKGILSMGLQGGFNFLGVDFSKLDLVDPTDPSFWATNSFKPNFGTGLFYHQKDFFVGLSVPFLMNNSVSVNPQNDLTKISEARYYFLRSGVILPLNPDKSIKFNPSILARIQEGQPLSFDINAGFIFFDLLSTGVSWRSGDALISFIDFKISEKFHFAYSYDCTASGIRKYSNGTHEFMINYRAKVTQSHKGMPCPTYYQYGNLEPKIKKGKQFNFKKKKRNGPY